MKTPEIRTAWSDMLAQAKSRLEAEGLMRGELQTFSDHQRLYVIADLARQRERRAP